MTATAPAAALVPVQLAVADPERVAFGGFPGWVQRADPRSARAGPAPAHQLVPCPLSALVRREPRAGCRGSGRRREELQGNSVRVAEGDPGAVVGVLDPAVHDAELVQARGPPLQFIAVAAGERDMIKSGAVLVEFVTCCLGVGMQAQ